MRSPNVAKNLGELRRQRSELGDADFTRILRGHLDQDSVRNVLKMTALTAT
ncbi:MAG: hypothetical protein ABW215_19220 [Kibdelosporangium sp.]